MHILPSLSVLALMGALISPALAQSPIPPNVIVGTEEMEAKDFTIWEETDLAKYDGTFSGEVGGDSGGTLKFKTAKPKEEESSASASGSYSLAPAGAIPTVVKFENAVYYGDPKGVFDASVFRIVFVKYGKIRGVILGNVFIPKTKT